MTCLHCSAFTRPAAAFPCRRMTVFHRKYDHSGEPELFSRHAAHKRAGLCLWPSLSTWFSRRTCEIHPVAQEMSLTLSSMIQSSVMNRRSKVTKRQKVLLTSEMHFFSPASYEPTRARMVGLLTGPTSLPVSRDSALLLHRLSILA